MARVHLIASASMLSLMLAGPAWAQGAGDNAGADEIIVTAQKRDESLQEVAAAATVIGGSALQTRGIERMDDLQSAVPSLSISDAGLTQSVNIRGIGLASGSPNAANGVATYFDGVFQPPIVTTNSFYDIRSVEVFRGPQGTFVGSNSTGGAIFINSRDPEMGSYDGFVEGELGNFGLGGVTGAVNLGVSDDVAIRMAGIYRNRDSFYDRVDGASPPADLEEKGGRLGIKWAPSNNFRVLLKAEFGRKRSSGYAYRPVGTFDALGGSDAIYTLNYNTPTQNDEENDALTAKVEFETAGGVTLRSISGYQNKRIHNLYDSDAVSALANTRRQYVREREWTQELNLISPDTGPLTWILGGYFQRNRIDVAIVDNEAAPVHVTVDIANKKTTTGLFGQATYQVTPQLKLDVGARYSWYAVDGTGAVNLIGAAPVPIFLADPGGRERDSQLTGKVALNWTPSENHLFYAFVAKGYKSGGIQSPVSNFRPEKVIDYEIGWKGTFLDGAVTTQFGGFYYDYKSFQLDAINPTTGQLSVINLTSAKVKGIEGQIQAKLGGFRFSGGFGYTDSSLKGVQFVDIRGVGAAFPGVSNAPQCPVGVPSTPPFCLDYTPFVRTGGGGPNLFSPKWTWNLDASYEFRFGEAKVVPQLTLSHVGARWTYIGYDPVRDRLAGYTVLNANLTVDLGRYALSLWATNLTKERYVSGQDGSTGFYNEFYGAPRQYGLRARVEF